MNFILVAAKGQKDWFRALFGGTEDEVPTAPAGPPRDARGEVIKLTPKTFDITFDLPEKVGRRPIRHKVMPNG